MDAPEPSKRFLTFGEARAALGITQSALRKHIRDGRLSAVEYRSMQWISAASVRAYQERNRVPKRSP